MGEYSSGLVDMFLRSRNNNNKKTLLTETSGDGPLGICLRALYTHNSY